MTDNATDLFPTSTATTTVADITDAARIDTTHLRAPETKAATAPATRSGPCRSLLTPPEVSTRERHADLYQRQVVCRWRGCAAWSVDRVRPAGEPRDGPGSATRSHQPTAGTPGITGRRTARCRPDAMIAGMVCTHPDQVSDASSSCARLRTRGTPAPATSSNALGVSRSTVGNGTTPGRVRRAAVAGGRAGVVPGLVRMIAGWRTGRCWRRGPASPPAQRAFRGNCRWALAVCRSVGGRPGGGWSAACVRTAGGGADQRVAERGLPAWGRGAGRVRPSCWRFAEVTRGHMGRCRHP